MTQEEMKNIEALCVFIPYFENIENIAPNNACQWIKSEKSEDGVITLPYPVYNEEFMNFIDTFYKCEILVSDYQNELNKRVPDWQTADMNKIIETADYQKALTVLTKCIRVERFNSGAWERAIKSGLFLSILRRLKTLVENEKG